MEKEIEYKINMLFSSDFYNAIDNQSLPKYSQFKIDSWGPHKTNCKHASIKVIQVTQHELDEGRFFIWSINHVW